MTPGQRAYQKLTQAQKDNYALDHRIYSIERKLGMKPDTEHRISIRSNLNTMKRLYGDIIPLDIKVAQNPNLSLEQQLTLWSKL